MPQPTTKQHAIIFGCGSAARRAYSFLAERYAIVGFADNNSKLHGSLFLGHLVHPPTALPRLQFDRVVIASMYESEIRRQLVAELSIPEEKIVLAPTEDADASAASTLGDGENPLSRYLAEGYHQISGWLHWPAVQATLLLGRIQHEHLAPGPVGEIGVWEGRYLTLLSFLPESPRPVLGIDPFIHGGDRAAQVARVRRNIARYARRPDLVKLLETDSRQVSPAQLLTAAGAPFQFVSVDGDHTAPGCLQDLVLAGDILAPGGIVSVDDMANMTCPGVVEAVVRYCLRSDAKLAPFLSVANKLFMTQPEFCERYRTAVLARATAGGEYDWAKPLLDYDRHMRSLNVPVEFMGQNLLVLP
jgi:hypothetical protein